MKKNVDEKLANDFASSPGPEAQALLEQYNQLNLSAQAGAKKVVSRCKSLKEAWVELLPTLDEMQKLLSQRGDEHDSRSAAALPTWTQWVKDYLKATGLGVSVRSVQLHLAKLRRLGKRNTIPSEPPIKLTPRDQRRLLKAAQCGNELIEALERGSGRDYIKLMQEYKRIGMDTEKIDQLLVTVSQPRAALPKPGDGSALFDYINGCCGDGVKIALGGPDPCVMAACIQKFAERLADFYCARDREGGKIEVKIEFVQADAVSLQQAA
jgi:hypothetical protein